MIDNIWYDPCIIKLVKEDTFMRYAQSTADNQSQQNKENIHQWLLNEGWQVGEEQSNEASWILKATDIRGKRIIVGQSNKRVDMIIIEAGVITDINIQNQLSSIEEYKRRKFYFNLQEVLLKMGVEYEGVGDPFRQIMVTQRIYQEALIRDTFIQRVLLVRNAQVAILLKINELMNQPPITPPEPPPIGFRAPDKI